MPVPPSGGSNGTWPRIGQRTRSRISSTFRRSPAASPSRIGAPGRAEASEPRGVAGARSAHPGLEDAADAVALEQECQAGDVILVRVAQDDRVDPAVPRRDPAIEGHEQAIRIRSAVDEEPAAPGAFDEDRVALPDVEDRDPGAGAGCRGDHGTGDEQRTDQRDSADAGAPFDRRPALDAARARRRRPDRRDPYGRRRPWRRPRLVALAVATTPGRPAPGSTRRPPRRPAAARG